MSKCPHCSASSFTLFAKWWSGSSSPSRCRVCGGLAYARTSEATGIHGISSVLFVAAVGAGFLAKSLPAFLLGAVLAVAFYVFAWRQVKLVPISEQSARTGRRHGWIFVAAVVVLAAIATQVSAAELRANRAFEPTRNGWSLQAPISFWAFRAQPPLAAQLQRWAA
jgi:hypothetical protein